MLWRVRLAPGPLHMIEWLVLVGVVYSSVVTKAFLRLMFNKVAWEFLAVPLSHTIIANANASRAEHKVGI